MNFAEKVGIIIQCRYDSTRLPGKALLKINGKETLGYVCERMKTVELADNIVVATSDERADDLICEYCKTIEIDCYRASKENVALRMLSCAREYGFNYFVRICADSIFMDQNVVDQLIEIALKGKYDLVSNRKGKTFPAGVSVEVIKTDFYEQIFPSIVSKEDREHVTTYLHGEGAGLGERYYVYNEACPEANKIKLALDDSNDLALAGRVLLRMDRHHTDYSFIDIYNIVSGRT